MSEGNRKKRLTKDQLMELINCRIQNNNSFNHEGKKGRSIQAWEMIRKKLSFGGQNYDAKDIRKIWANLLRKYKELKDPPTGAGTDRGEETPLTWPYYETIDNFMKNDHNINPPFLLCTLEDENGSASTSSPTPSLNMLVEGSDLRETLGVTAATPSTSSNNRGRKRTTLDTMLRYMKKRDKKDRKIDKAYLSVLTRSLLNEEPYFSDSTMSSDSD